MTKFIAICLFLSSLFAILFAENRLMGNITGQWTFGVLLAISWLSASVAIYRHRKSE